MTPPDTELKPPVRPIPNVPMAVFDRKPAIAGRSAPSRDGRPPEVLQHLPGLDSRSGWPTGAISCSARSSGSCRWSRRSCSGDRSIQVGCRASRDHGGFRAIRGDDRYLLLTHISRMFSSMPNLAGGIARDIREGTLKRYLIQPLDLIGYLDLVSGGSQGGVHRHLGLALRPCSSFLCRKLLPRTSPTPRPWWRTCSRWSWRSWWGSSSRSAWGWLGSGSWRSRHCFTS